MSYIGNEPIVSATRTVTEVTATAGQTVFTANGGYTVGFLDVFINGSKLTSADFTATDGSTVTLTEAAQVSDIVRLEALGTFLASSALSNVNPNYTGTLTGGTGVVNIGSGQVYKDASGNVGVGTASPDIYGFGGKIVSVQGGASYTNLMLAGDVNSGIAFGSSTARVGQISVDSTSGMAIYAQGTGSTLSALFDRSGNFRFNSGYGSVATAYGCRAWVNFNGTGTVAIRGSGNVSSITDNATGDYTINFTTAMPDVNYSAAGSASMTAGGGGSNGDAGVIAPSRNYTAYATGSFRVDTVISSDTSGNRTDALYANIAIFR